MTCSNCGSDHISKNGKKSGVQQYRCNACKHQWLETKQKKKDEDIAFQGEGHSFDESGLTAQAIVNSHRIKTLQDLIAVCEIDETVWNIDRHTINAWEVTNAQGEVRTNHQVKAFLSRIDGGIDFEEMKAGLLQEIAAKSPKRGKVKAASKQDPHLLLINIFDLHLGKLAWHEETGEDYDIKIAEERFHAAVDDLTRKASGFEVDRIVLPVGNDFFNSDNDMPSSVTSNGTPQENDSRWQKIFRKGCQMYSEAILRLSHVAPVEVITVPGNHDTQKTFYLGEVLWGRFFNDENVTVLNPPGKRAYIDYGKTLLGFTHGNAKDESEKRLVQLMQIEQREKWGKVKYAEWLLGDVHHSRTVKLVAGEDHQGVMLRYMRSLSGTDAWHHQKGFIGQQKGAEAYLYSRDRGPAAAFYYMV
jgi:hypothetical protein